MQIPRRQGILLAAGALIFCALTSGGVAARSGDGDLVPDFARKSIRAAASGLPLQQEPETERDARELLLNAKDALSSGNIRYLRARLGSKVYLNLFTGINGYYSAEQAFLILESFFSTYAPISFSFSSRNFSIRNPYGFGPLSYERRGRRGTAEMFISLAQVGDRWVINQITVASR